MTKTLETVVNGSRMLVDLEAVWRENFAYWDRIVSTKKAEKIASAILAILEED